MNRFFPAAAAALALLAPALAAAAEPAVGNAWRVDVLVFAHAGADNAGAWQTTTVLPPCNAVLPRDNGPAEPAFADTTHCRRGDAPIDDNARALVRRYATSPLASQAARLKSAGHGVLANTSWRQFSYSGGNLPVLVQGGATQATGRELTGTVTLLDTGKYTDVQLDFTLAGGSADAPQYARLEERRKLKTGEPNYFDHPLFGVILEVSPAGAEGP